MSLQIDFDPDVFHGELTANRAQVFVRAERRAEWSDCTLAGFIHGPRCEYAHTLPAKFSLTDLGAGPTLLARSTITDPCFWTSDLPQIYDVHVELRRGNDVLAKEQRMLGLRGIGVRQTATGGQLFRESKSWVPRGVAVELLDPLLVAELREHLLTANVAAPPLDLLVEASRGGLYLIARIDGSLPNVSQLLRGLARWPAVMMAVIQNGERFDRSLQQVAPNLLLAQQAPDKISSGWRPASWGHLLLSEVSGDPPLPQTGLTNSNLPVLITRCQCDNLSAPAARAECDRLQRDLAATGQFAGYFVTRE